MNVIEIKNSSFAYKDKDSSNERKVLTIDELDIKPGEITFIVGVSGAGKSTMLETIGLMNDTFPSDMKGEMEINFNIFDSESGKITTRDITAPNIWKETPENIQLREKIRRDNYSFIFQNTNLMHNFTALENVCITDMLNGHCFEEAYLKALLIFKTLGLGDLDLDISPQNVSGGQRQRIAFARALIPEYRVLFGDEPTGNLDRKTSLEVMGILHDYIKSTQPDAHAKGKDTSTVIVSHDLELAVKYADRIIVITKEDGKGTIEPEHIFVNNDRPTVTETTPDFKIIVNRIFSSQGKEQQIIDIRKSIMVELTANRDSASGRYEFRNYITVNDFLEALADRLNSDSGVLAVYGEEFSNYLSNSILLKGTASQNTVEDFTEPVVVEKKGACHNWSTPCSRAAGNEQTYTKRQVVKEIEKLLSVDNDQRDKKAEEKDPAENNNNDGRRRIKDYLYHFFLWLTHRIPDRTGLNPQFTRLFYEKESIELLGYHNKLRNFWTVFIIMLVTFIAIGFANGSLLYLGEKMKDPFVKSINVAVKHDRQGDVDKLIDELNADTLTLATYGIDRATGFTIFPLEFTTPNGDDKMLTGRTMNINDPILTELLKPSNVVHGEVNGFRSETDIGLIISSKFFDDLQMDENSKFVYVNVMKGENEFVEVPVPVRTVLERLPGDLDDEISFVMTGYLHANLVLPIMETIIPFDPDNTKSLVLHIDTQDTAVADKVVGDIRTWLSDQNSKVDIDGKTFRVRQPKLLKYYTDSTTYEKGFTITISFMGRKPDYHQIEQFYNNLSEKVGLDNSFITMLYSTNLYSLAQVNDAERRLDRLTIHFASLGHIEDFEEEHVKVNYPYLNLDMAKIESLKNYNYVTNLTMGLSIILIILSVYSIASFLSNVFENHLTKIKMNIGTLMAFGTGGLKQIYRRLMMIYLLIPLSLSLLIAHILGKAGLLRFIMSIFLDDLGKNPFFSLFAWGDPPHAMPLIFTTAAIFSIIYVTLQRYKHIIKHLLQKTPGDLIFGRDSHNKKHK